MDRRDADTSHGYTSLVVVSDIQKKRGQVAQIGVIWEGNGNLDNEGKKAFFMRYSLIWSCCVKGML